MGGWSRCFFLLDHISKCVIREILLFHLAMKKNTYTRLIALLTLAACLLLGAVFGKVARMSDMTRTDDIGRSVASSLK